VIRQVVQCRPGTVEQVLLLLRQKIEEKQKQSKVRSPVLQGQRCVGQDAEELGVYVSSVGCEQRCGRGQLLSRCFLSWSRVMKSHHGCAQAPPGDDAVCLQLAEREQALLLAQETIQILQLKVGRLEQLLHLKNVRIDDLSRRLQEAQCQQR
ncbi:SPEF1 protein, partial [Grus americana]|nr:SPEF1 protein [Grus americana]